jgi:hypothetical protein
VIFEPGTGEMIAVTSQYVGMPVFASAGTTTAVCTTVLGNSPGLVRSVQFGAAPTCCDVTTLVTTSAPRSIHSRLCRIVTPQ